MNNKATVFFKAGKDNYAFPFPYLSKQFVKVRYDKKQGADELEYNRDYTIEGQTVMLRQKGDEQSTICIYRQTPTGSLVDFNDGSILLASEMDKMAMQMLHIEEENSDYLLINGMLTDKTTNAWQGQGRRIAHLEDPIDAQDAVTLHHLETVGGMASLQELQDIKEETLAIKKDTNDIKNMAYEHRQTAIQAYQLTEASKEAVKTMENNVLALRNEVGQQSTHIEQMQEYVQKAEQYVNQKEADAGRSKEQAEQAATAAINAKDKATQAETNANEASRQAALYSSEALDSVKTAASGIDRAYQLANEAKTRATEAAQSATHAQQSATAAAGGAVRAENAAQSAQQYAAEAQSHAHFNGVIETHNIKDGAVTEEKMDTALCKKLLQGFAMAYVLAHGTPYTWRSLMDWSKMERGTLYEKDIFLRDFFYLYTSIYILYEAPLTSNGAPILHIKPYTGPLLYSALEKVEQFNLTGDSNAPYVVKGHKNNTSSLANYFQFIPNSSTNRCGIVDIIGFKFYE